MAFKLKWSPGTVMKTRVFRFSNRTLIMGKEPISNQFNQFQNYLTTYIYLTLIFFHVRVPKPFPLSWNDTGEDVRCLILTP